MYGQAHHQTLLSRDEDDLMFPMEATEEEEATRRTGSYRSSSWDCCQEADEGPGQPSVGGNLIVGIGWNLRSYLISVHHTAVHCSEEKLGESWILNEENFGFNLEIVLC